MAVQRGSHIIKLHDSNPPLLGRAPGVASAAVPVPSRDEGLITKHPPATPSSAFAAHPAFALIVGPGCRARGRGVRPRRPGGAHRPPPGARPRQPALGLTGEARTQVRWRQGPREPTEAGLAGSSGGGAGGMRRRRGPSRIQRRREQGQRRSTRARREESGGRELPAQG